MREDELLIKEQDILLLIQNFLTYNYVTSDYKYITAKDLRQHFLEYSFISYLSTSKFSKLITIIINSFNINLLNIKRKKIKTGNVLVIIVCPTINKCWHKRFTHDV